MDYSKAQLINYRIARAKETLEDAELLATKERWHSAANRLYYACFYSAYLADMNIKVTTHSGLKSCFNKELVKTDKVDKEDGKIFNRLFLIIQEADYEDLISVEKNTIELLLPKIKSLIDKIAQIIQTV